MKRKFYRYGELFAQFGFDDETARQAALTGELSAFLELRDIRARYETDGGIAPENGSGTYGSWRYLGCPKSKNKGDDFLTPLLHEYRLNGWFRLARASLTNLARHGSFKIFPRVVPPAECAATAQDGDFFSLSYAHLEKDIDDEPYYGLRSDLILKETSLNDLWFFASDIESMRTDSELSTNPEPDKPLDERERASALRIIRALDVMAKLPERGAATSIEAQLRLLGFNRTLDSTIRKFLKAARALEPDNKPQ